MKTTSWLAILISYRAQSVAIATDYRDNRLVAIEALEMLERKYIRTAQNLILPQSN